MSYAISNNSTADEATTRFSSFKRASPQIEGTLRKFALLRQPSNDDAIELVDGVTIIQRSNFRQSPFKLNVSILQAAITVRDGRVFVKDISRNGTFIKKPHNDDEFRRMEKETQIVEIKDGDLIAFGGPEFIMNLVTKVNGRNPYIYKLNVSSTNTYVR
jgi:hypothetical protein